MSVGRLVIPALKKGELPMNWKKSFLIVLAMTASYATFAQTLYKSVGPDGKTVYSDKPPATANTKSTVVSAPAQSSQTSATTDARRPVDASVAQESMNARKAAAQKARRSETLPEAAPAELAVDPAVEKALINVMGMED